MYHVNFKSYRMMCHLFFSHGARLHITCQFKEMAMSNLGVKSLIIFIMERL